MEDWKSSFRKLATNPLVICSAVALSAYIYQNYETAQQLEDYINKIKESIDNYSFSWRLAESIPQDESTVGKSVPEIIDASPGFKCEIHQVTTEDGYILELHRILVVPEKLVQIDESSEDLESKEENSESEIPKPSSGHLVSKILDSEMTDSRSAQPTQPKNSYPPKKPILLQHGILADSSNWILNGSNKDSLAFALALTNHDVWLANSRGNTYSKKHVKYNSEAPYSLNEEVVKNEKDKAKYSNHFWNFTWFEMSAIDLPNIVDYILDQTSSQKLDFVGHSQGSLIMLVALDRSPQFRSKIDNFHALAPISWLTHMKSPLKYIALSSFADKLIYHNWHMEIMSSANNYTTAWLHDKFGGLSGNRDVPILTTLVGLNPRRYQLNKIKTYLTHFTSGTSIQNIMHFAQMIKWNSICTHLKTSESDAVGGFKGLDGWDFES